MKDKIVFYFNKKIFFFMPDDVYCLQGDGSYTIISVNNAEQYRVAKNLKNFAAALPDSCSQFLRVQRSWMVILNHVNNVYTNANSRWFLLLNNNMEIPLSSVTVVKQILELINPKYMNQLETAFINLQARKAKLKNTNGAI